MSEDVRIREASFNGLISDEVFSLAGIKMIPNHPIRVANRPTFQRLANGKLVALETISEGSPAKPPPAPVVDPADRRLNPWLVAVCAVLALAAGFLIVKKIRARRATP